MALPFNISSSTFLSITSSIAKSDRWLGIIFLQRLNQKFETSVRIEPLPGMGSGKITSNAESLSLVTINKCLSSML